MTKKRASGGKTHRRGRGGGGGHRGSESGALLVPEGSEQMYARVAKLYGDKRCECTVLSSTNEETSVLGVIRGSLRRKVCAGDLVLCARREFQDSKVDIFYVYKEDEIKELRKFTDCAFLKRHEEELFDCSYVVEPQQEAKENENELDIDIDTI